MLMFPDNSARCSVIFINKGLTVDSQVGNLTVQWEGNGPGIDPDDTVDAFECEINSGTPRPCE